MLLKWQLAQNVWSNFRIKTFGLAHLAIHKEGVRCKRWGLIIGGEPLVPDEALGRITFKVPRR